MFHDVAAYDAFMGRWSVPLAGSFLEACRVPPGGRVLDVGCGTGSLTAELLARGAREVAACDPSPAFAAACHARFPEVEVRVARAEALPYDDDSFDAALAELVLHFLDDPDAGAAETARVVRPGGRVGACVWEVGGMGMLRLFWDAALAESPDAPDEARTHRFGGSPGEIAALLARHGLVDVEEARLAVSSTYAGFEELWAALGGGAGPAGSYLASLPTGRRDAVRAGLLERLGAPSGPFTLHAVALSASGTLPPRAGT
jgi:SAM-dependent methyltransferase